MEHRQRAADGPHSTGYDLLRDIVFETQSLLSLATYVVLRFIHLLCRTAYCYTHCDYFRHFPSRALSLESDVDPWHWILERFGIHRMPFGDGNHDVSTTIHINCVYVYLQTNTSTNLAVDAGFPVAKTTEIARKDRSAVDVGKCV